MKTNIILIALFVAAFMFPSIESVDTADAETDISHCANFEATASRTACEAAAHGQPDPAATFDGTLGGTQGTAGSAQTTYKDSATSGYSSDAPAQKGWGIQMNGPYGTSTRQELRENNRLRNGIPGSGQKMK